MNKIILFILISLPLKAAVKDEEIINNLDFFENLQLIKDDNPYLSLSFLDNKIEMKSDHQSVHKEDKTP
jgi:thioredoxin-related protein